MKLLLTILVFTSALSAQAEKQTPAEYIEKYKDLAVIEMHRSGVPASITLAQGILESNSGNSRLAKYANNHFGIKCKGSWTGNVIYADDDAPDECFRAYDNVLDSYRDHSDFLRKNWRYHPLFELQPLDYKGWCKGLRKAGYATNPQYGNILINLIERYDLNKFDHEKMPGTGLPALEMGTSNNGVPIKTAAEGESVSSIAKDHYVKEKHIRKWNDLPKNADISEGDLVYLKPKRRRGSESEHKVVEGESMHDISQKYGIKMKQLYKKNRMEFGVQPKAGEVLYMQKKRSSESVVKLADKKPSWEEPKEKEFVNPHSKVKTKDIDFSNPGALDKKDVDVPEYHTVVKGDNIYRIAEKYRVFEEDLLAWNADLNPTTMSLGQKIYLSKEAAEANHNIAPPAPETPEVESPKSDSEVEAIKKEIVVNGPVYHIVVKGDTLYNLCKRYGVTEDQLKEWNKMETITVRLGEKLQVSE